MARLFLSYAKEQRDLADAINLSLMDRGHDVFFDRDDLPHGQTFDRQIEKALKKTKVFIFLVSPQSVEDGRFTLTELKTVRDKWPKPNGRVLPVIVAPTPNQDIPTYLRAVNYLEPSGNTVAEVSQTVDKMLQEQSKAKMPGRVAAGLVAASILGGGAYLELTQNYFSNLPFLQDHITDTPASFACAGPAIYDNIMDKKIAYSDALIIGEDCSNKLFPEKAEASAFGDVHEIFTQLFAEAVTSDDLEERKSAALLTRGDERAAANSFLLLGRNTRNQDTKIRFYRSAATIAYQYDPRISIEALENIVRLDDADVAALNMLSILYQNDGQIDKQNEVLARLGELSQEEGPNARANLIMMEAHQQSILGNLQTAIDKFREARDLFARSGNKWGEANAYISEGDVLFSQGRLPETIELIDEALSLGESYNFKDVQANAKTLRGRLYGMQYRFEDSKRELEEAVAIYESLNMRFNVGFAKNQLGLLAISMTDPVGARKMLVEAKADYESVGAKVNLAWIDLQLSQIDMMQGKPEDALDRLDPIVQKFQELNVPGGELQAYLNKSNVFMMMGRTQDALDILDTGLERARATGLRIMEAQILGTSGFVHRSNGNTQDARSYFEQSLQVAKALNNQPISMASCEQLAQLDLIVGDKDSARQYLQEALVFAEQIGDQLAAQRISFELNRL